MKRWFHTSVVLIVCWTASAQDVRFETSVEQRSVAAGQQFQVSFVATSTQSSGLRNFRPPDFAGFVVLSGPIESSQYQWINGRASSSLSYVYVVAIQKPGKYTIGAASVEHSGTTYTTKPVEIEATQAAAGSRPSPQSAVSDEMRENLFIRATTNKQKVRQGEQFIITYKLYTRVNIENYVISKAPTYEGFWAEDFDQPKSPEIANEVLEGKQYRVVVLKRTALFATQSGKLKITPLEVRCAVQVRRRSSEPFDIFNDPFFSRLRTEEVDFASNALSITVDPLAGTPPAGFSGATGSFDFSATVDRREVKTGEPITLKLTVSGSGNIKLVSVPSPAIPADFEAYEPKIAENLSRDGTLIRGTKTAEYLLIPRNAGERVVEPVIFTYFDLTKNAYVSQRSQRFVFSVSPGRESAAGSTLASKEDIRLLGEDIRFLKLGASSLIRADGAASGDTWTIVVLMVPVLFFGGTYLYRMRREQTMGNVSLDRSRKAGREATRRLKSAGKILAAGNTETYHAEVSRALFGYLSDKLRIPPSQLTLDTVGNVLRTKNVTEEIIGRLHSCLERAEFARFAPGADSREARMDLLDAATAAIDELERSLNGKS
ncbi:MAG: BatD family protein [Bacteroidota bacterium]